MFGKSGSLCGLYAPEYFDEKGTANRSAPAFLSASFRNAAKARHQQQRTEVAQQADLQKAGSTKQTPDALAAPAFYR